MRRTLYSAIALLLIIVLAAAAGAVTSSDILNKVKAAEAGLKDYRAEMVIDEANKNNVSRMGEGYGDILRLEKAVISYKKPDKIRYDGYAQGIKAAYVQNGYKKLIIAPMIKQIVDVKNAPGKRQDTLDLGFLSSRLWVDNKITVISTAKNGTVVLKFDPKFGDNDKRHDRVWVDPKTLRLLKREKYRGSGELRLRTVFKDWESLTSKLPIAATSDMFDVKGRSLGMVSYKNIKPNTGLSDSIFSLSQK